MSIFQATTTATRSLRRAHADIRVCFGEADRYAGEVVTTALARSFSTAQVVCRGDSATVEPGQCVAWINPPEDAAGDLTRVTTSGGKAIVLGGIGPRVAAALSLDLRGPVDLPPEWGDCQFNPRAHHDASRAAIRYCDAHPLAAQSPDRVRPLVRFDFGAEWNNLGFGRITLQRGAWSLQSAIEIGQATPLAWLATPADDGLVYAAIHEMSSGAALWFNRPVGPVDSLEWRIIESFLGDYRSDDLPCFPYISEIPAGYRGAVCARLDCDEAVATARPLVELYRDHGLPLSLALLTGQPLGAADLVVMREVIVSGGSVVSHSRHHCPNWGGSYERARSEALESRAWFDEHLPEAAPVRHAVSPFHQNPPYAVAALADSGYEGFLGGIIANDPECLLGRAGRVPFAPRPIVSLSTQCMLHGDCYRRCGDSINVYCQSFEQHLAARAVFGYLDHPFSARYQYGWSDESTRLAAHRGLIEHIRKHPDIWWASIAGVLNFLRHRDAALVAVDRSGRLSVERPHVAGCPPLAIHWKGREVAA